MPEQLLDKAAASALREALEFISGGLVFHSPGFVEHVGAVAELALDDRDVLAVHGGELQAKCLQNGPILSLPAVVNSSDFAHNLASHHVQQLLFPVDDLAEISHIIGQMVIDVAHAPGDDVEQVNQLVVELPDCEPIDTPKDIVQLCLGGINHVLCHLF